MQLSTSGVSELSQNKDFNRQVVLVLVCLKAPLNVMGSTLFYAFHVNMLTGELYLGNGRI